MVGHISREARDKYTWHANRTVKIIEYGQVVRQYQ